MDRDARGETVNESADALKVQQACQAVEELTRCAQAIDMLYLKLGQMLAYVKENELYKAYSEHTQTMSAFLREIDIGIGVSQADHYIRIYKTFGDRLAGRQIAFKRLLLIHPLVKDDATAEKWLDLAATLPYIALIATKREEQGKMAADTCDHPTVNLVPYFRCSICGAWIKKEGT